VSKGYEYLPTVATLFPSLVSKLSVNIFLLLLDSCYFIDQNLARTDIYLRYQGAAKTLHELSAHVGQINARGIIYMEDRTEQPKKRRLQATLADFVDALV
jgi:hypothetical protein